jgi:quinohemoprotein ethanol dehydrogenase
LVIDPKHAVQGEQLYNSTCFLCHGANALGTGSIAPDLRESVLALRWDAFRSVLHEGVLAAKGMPKYDELAEDDIRNIFLYIRQRARDARAVSPR